MTIKHDVVEAHHESISSVKVRRPRLKQGLVPQECDRVKSSMLSVRSRLRISSCTYMSATQRMDEPHGVSENGGGGVPYWGPHSKGILFRGSILGVPLVS